MKFLPLMPAFLLTFLLVFGGVTLAGELKQPLASSQPNPSFNKPPFINPRIVQDFATWISDKGDQVLSINLDDSQNSNRYFSETKTHAIKGRAPFVYCETVNVDQGITNSTSFGYRFIGQTTSGIFVLLTSQNTGGSGEFRSLMLLKIENSNAIETDWKKGVVKLGLKRRIVKKVGEIGLGDRWDGQSRVVGNSIEWGGDHGVFAGTSKGGFLSGNPKKRTLKIDVK